MDGEGKAAVISFGFHDARKAGYKCKKIKKDPRAQVGRRVSGTLEIDYYFDISEFCNGRIQ